MKRFSRREFLAALGATSAGLFESDTRAEVVAETLPMQRGHAEALVPLVERLMNRAGAGFADLSRVVVTVGPGSFTGLRIGISAARGFALARSVPVVGVSTLSAYAAPFIAASDSSIVAVAIDAHHGEVFFQVFAPGGRTMVSPLSSSWRIVRMTPCCASSTCARRTGPSRSISSTRPF